MKVPESWLAPAKLNLFLHVTGRRDDGYHELQTVFRFLDYADTLRIRVRGDGEIRRPLGLVGVAEEQDLVVRAARLLKGASGTHQGAEIEVDKRIPAGAGLGGGSSDAATTLLALNQLWELGFSRARLAALAARLGADVPVFVFGRSAWAEGIGERLRPIELEPAVYLVVIPPVHVSTPDVFRAPDLVRNHAPVSEADLAAGRVGNDLQAVASRLHPEVADALNWLSGFVSARMTGSGGAVFAEVASVADGEAVLAKLPTRFSGFVARGLDHHPHADDA